MRAQVSGNFRPPTAPPSSEETNAARDALIELIETCKDGEYTFRAAAAHMESLILGQLIANRANDYRQAARELQAQVVQLGGDPAAADVGGSASGALHRGWEALRTNLLRQTDDAVLGACERSEERAAARYQAALEQPLPEAVKEIVEQQAKEIRLCREQIQDLRERLKD